MVCYCKNLDSAHLTEVTPGWFFRLPSTATPPPSFIPGGGRGVFEKKNLL